MKRRWALRFALFVGGFLTAIVLVIQTEWAGQQLCARGKGLLGSLLREEVRLDRCSVDPLGALVEVEGIRIGGAVPLFAARRLLVKLAPLQAFGGTIAVETLELDQPEVALTLPEAGEEAPPREDGCLRFLDRVRVGDLQIRGARADLALPGKQLVSVRGLNLTAERKGGAYDVTAEVTGGGLDDGELHAPLERLQAQLRLDTAEEHLEVRKLDLQVGGVELFLGGEVSHLCRPELGLRIVARTGVGSLFRLAGGTAEGRRGTVSLDAQLEGTAAEPGVVGKLEVRGLVVDDLEPGDLDAQFHLAEKTAYLDQLVWQIAEGRAVVSGDVRLHGDFPVQVDVRTEALEFHRLLARLPIKNTPVTMTIDSHHHLAGKLRGGLELVGQSSLELHDFRVRNVPWHVPEGRTIVEVPGKSRLETPIRITPEGIELESARITVAGGTVIDAPTRLSFSHTKGLSIHAVSGHLDLAHVNGHVGGLSMEGAGRVEAHITGPYGENDISGRIELEGARFLAGELGTLAANVHAVPGETTLDFLEVQGRRGSTSYSGEVKLQLGGPEPEIHAQLTVPEGGRLEDGFGSVRGAAYPLAWLEQHLQGRIQRVTGKLDGRLSSLRATGEIAATEVTLLDRRFDSLETSVEFDGESLKLPGVKLARGSGHAEAVAQVRLFPAPGEGAARKLPALDVTVDAEGLPIRELLGELGELGQLQGGVGAHAKLTGPIGELELTGELFAQGLSARGVPLLPARLELVTRGGEVQLAGPICGAGELRGVLRLEDGLPFEANFAVQVADLSRYLREGAGIGGELRGTVDARGSLAELGDAQGAVALSRMALVLRDYKLENQGEVRAEFSGSAFVLDGLSVRGENTELHLYGNRSRAGVLDLQADGRFDARLMDTAVPQIEHSTGVIDLKAAVTGTAQRPVLVGSAEIQHGAFRVKALPIQVQKLESTLAFSQNQIVIEQATMTTNQGRATARGTVALKDWAPGALDILADLERVGWRLPEDWPAIVSGRLTLGGSFPDAMVLSGDLNVDRLRYVKALDLERAVLDFGSRVRRAPAADEKERLKLDLGLIGGNDMRIDNNLVKAKLQFVAPPGARDARLRLVGSNVRLGLLGSVELVDATAVFRGNEYRVTQGVVQFDQRDRIDPTFDVGAETEVRDYRVTVHAYGRLPEPGDSSRFELQLTSLPALAQADILGLLTLGITSRDANAGGGAAAASGVAAEALLAVSGLDEHVKRWIPSTKVFQDPNLSVTSQYSEVTGQLEPMAIFEAKVLSERLKLKAATPFSTSKGRRASAEYRIDEHVSGQVVWENEDTGYSAGDVGADMKLRWEWE